MWNKKESNYIPSNKITLDKLSDNGTNLLFNGSAIAGGSTQVNVSGRTYSMFSLRGGQIITKKAQSSDTVSYSFPNLDTNRHRRMFVWKGGGGAGTYIDIPDGTLLANDALVYDISTNTLATRNGSFGNVNLTVNEVILLYNNLGIIGGVLSKYCVDGDSAKNYPVMTPKTYNTTDLSGVTVQALTFIGNKLWSFDKDTDTSNAFILDPVTFVKIKTIPHTLGYWNNADYNSDIDCIVQGNGTGASQYTDNKVRVYYNVSAWENLATLTNATVDFIDIDLFQLNATGNNDSKVQACWGDDNFGNHNIIYVVTNDGRTIRKLMLGKGASNLGSGIFTSGLAANRYNGTYKVLNLWSQEDGGGNSQDLVFHDGALYSNSKRSLDAGYMGLVVNKFSLMFNGNINRKMIYIPVYDNTTGNLVTSMGSGEGLTIKDGVIYCALLTSPIKMFTIPLPV